MVHESELFGFETVDILRRWEQKLPVGISVQSIHQIEVSDQVNEWIIPRGSVGSVLEDGPERALVYFPNLPLQAVIYKYNLEKYPDSNDKDKTR